MRHYPANPTFPTVIIMTDINTAEYMLRAYRRAKRVNLLQ